MKHKQRLLLVIVILSLIFVASFIWFSVKNAVIMDLVFRPTHFSEKKIIRQFNKDRELFFQIEKMLILNTDIRIYIVLSDDMVRVNKEFHTSSELENLSAVKYNILQDLLDQIQFRGVKNHSWGIEFIRKTEFELYYGIVFIRDYNNIELNKYSRLQRIEKDIYFFIGH